MSIAAFAGKSQPGRPGLSGSKDCGASLWVRGVGLRARLALVVGLTLLAGCQQADREASLVDYGTAAPGGTWHPDVEGQGTAGASAEPQPAAPAAAGNVGAVGGSIAPSPATGAGGGVAEAGRPGGAASSGMAGSVARAGSGGADGAAGAAGVASSAMTFEVLTARQGGKYAPKNIGAIWVETQSGAFVKTLELWAATRRRYLYRFAAETGGNVVDAVTSATLRSHMLHHVAWDLTDVNGTAVASGPYKVIVECTDHESQGETIEVPFQVGDSLTLMLPDQSYYTDMRLVVQ